MTATDAIGLERQNKKWQCKKREKSKGKSTYGYDFKKVKYN